MAKITEDDLREILNEAAESMAGLYDNPRSWQAWIIYLLERLEEQSTRLQAGDLETFKEMLAALQDGIRTRTRTGGW